MAKPNLIIFTLLSLFSLLAGCTTTMTSAAGRSTADDLRLVSQGIAATLTTAAREPLAPDATVVTTTFVEVDNLKQSSTLGRALSGHITSALNDMGYRVVSLNLTQSLQMRESVGELVLSRDVQELLEQRLQADALITGTYYATRSQVFVTSRLIDPHSGEILASHESRILLTDDLARLLPPRLPWGHSRR